MVELACKAIPFTASPHRIEPYIHTSQERNP